MIEMPPLQFADTNGIRMGFYEAGPKADHPPVVLCHGWPEIAFSWRHQIKALAEAGIRVIAPDQRGYGATDRPEPVEAYDLTHLTGDLVGLLDHLKIDKAIFVGHDWGGFVVWQMALRHRDRVAGVVGVNTPHYDRAPSDPIELMRKRFGEQMYIVQFQDSAHFPSDVVPGDGMHIVYPLLLGMNRGRYFLMTGQTLDAAEALRLGLVAEVLPPDKLMARAWELAEDLTRKPTLLLRYTRLLFTEYLRRQMHDLLGYGLAMESLALFEKPEAPAPKS